MLHLNQFQKPNVYPDNGYLGQDVAETDTLIVSLCFFYCVRSKQVLWILKATKNQRISKIHSNPDVEWKERHSRDVSRDLAELRLQTTSQFFAFCFWDTGASQDPAASVGRPGGAP